MVQELRNLNNFSSMAGVVAGLNSAPITRLKRTKELLSAKTASLKANLDATLDSSKNFANYKDMLKTINPPCVPFFGTHHVHIQIHFHFPPSEPLPVCCVLFALVVAEDEAD